jgi:hypothetical protein
MKYSNNYILTISDRGKDIVIATAELAALPCYDLK